MTRAEYKQARRQWFYYVNKYGIEIARGDVPGLVVKIRDYEWAHGLRYVVWRVRWSLLDKSGGDMTFAESLRQARRFASVQRAYGFSYVRITRAARKPKGSP